LAGQTASDANPSAVDRKRLGDQYGGDVLRGNTAGRRNSLRADLGTCLHCASPRAANIEFGSCARAALNSL
jgi:hypothetical protein